MSSRLLPILMAEQQAISTNAIATAETPPTASNSEATDNNTSALRGLITALGDMPGKVADAITTGARNIFDAMKTLLDTAKRGRSGCGR
jgi:hypothetical protein